jgi:hypothetical protein
MVTISLGIAPLHFGIDQALPDGSFGNVFIVVALFLIPFAIHANGLMVDDRKYSGIFWRQFPVAALTFKRTR